MYKNIDDYLVQLKRELKGSDPALIQDALSDAEEHLSSSLEILSAGKPGMSKEDVLKLVIDKYGEPIETASAYKEFDARFTPSLIQKPKKEDTSSFLARFFGVIAKPRTWGAFLYMILSCITGSFFGLWALLGSIFSLITLVSIIGIPIVGLFFLSVKGLGLMEGRIVEALLGVRMPRRPLFVSRGPGWTGKFKALVMESHTWKTLLYMIVMAPLGWIYFFVAALGLAASLSFAAAPIFELILHLPMEVTGPDKFTPVWLLPFVSIGGIFMTALLFHLVRSVAKIHGKFAKTMLVRK